LQSRISNGIRARVEMVKIVNVCSKLLARAGIRRPGDDYMLVGMYIFQTGIDCEPHLSGASIIACYLILGVL
jgi:hypothetical protein